LKKKLFLHNLVNSLTKNEKAYFTKSLSEGDSAYKKLFKLVSLQKEYNENELIRNFSGSYIGNHFAFAKNYLYNSILSSLIGYNNSKKDAYYYFNSVAHLYKKGLYGQCANLLKLLLKKVEKKQDYLSILRIIQYSKLLRHSMVHNDTVLNDLVMQESEILNKLYVVSTFQDLLSEVNAIRASKGGLKEIETVNRLKELKEHKILNDSSYDLNEYCRHMYHETLFLIGFLLEDDYLTEKHIAPLEEMIILSSDSDYMNDYRKIDIIKQLIRYNILRQSFTAAQENMDTLRTLLNTQSSVNKSERIAAFSYLYSFQTDLYLNQNKLDNVHSSFDEIEAFIQANRGIIPKEFFVVIKGNMLVLNFMLKDYPRVIELCNEVLLNKKHELRKDIWISTMLAEIAAYYELKKYELVEYKLKALFRFLVSHKIRENIWKLFANYYLELVTEDQIKLSSQKFIAKLNRKKSNRLLIDLKFIVRSVESKC
jgi:hypothetical protein